MQSKPNQKQNPQVNPEHHCAKCNILLAGRTLPQYFLWLTLWDPPKSARCCSEFWIPHPFVNTFLHLHGESPCLPVDHGISQLATKSMKQISIQTSNCFRHRYYVDEECRLLGLKCLTVSSLSSHSTSDKSTLL